MHDVSFRRLQEGPKRSQTDSSVLAGVTSVRLHFICIVQALLAACIFTVTEHDDHRHSFWCTFEIAVQSLLVVTATVFIRTRVNRVAQSAAVMPMMVMVVCLSLICEPIRRFLLGDGHAFEMLVMHSQCNLMLALAVCGFRPSYQRLSLVLSIFITIFCCTISNAGGLIPFVAAYSVAAVVWLVAAWWENVNRRVLNETRRAMPKLQLAAVAGIPVLLLLSAGGAGANRATNAINGWLPGSGGTGEYDPFARGGVNDGDALVAGNKNIKSFAAIEDAPFLDSDKPSLYDVVNDTFDEPAKPSKKQDRAISLPAKWMQHVHQQISEARQAGREFSLVRDQQKTTGSQARDLNAHALFHVAGRTPLHLKMEVFELFDGFRWLASEQKLAPEFSVMRTVEERPWFSISFPMLQEDFFSGTETHSLKISGLDGNVIPAPVHLAGVNIPLVDRLNMYQLDSTGIVSLNRESVPTMTPVNLVSQLVDRRAVAASEVAVLDFSKKLLKTPLSALPTGEDMDRVHNLADRLTTGKSRGWEQIVAVEQYLRGEYTLDRGAKVSLDTNSPVEEFLFETKCGPEYLFAGSAAVLLRSLGYRARVVSGFYAHPDKYDNHRHHTPVHAADAHVWCEVSLSSTWLTVEPSPGYEVLAPLPGVWEQVVERLHVLWRSIVHNAVLCGILAIALLIAVLQRRALESALRTLEWQLARTHNHRARAARLARLIDHRLRLAGLPRQNGTTLRRWAVQPELTSVRDNLSRIADLADQATFDPGSEQLSIEPGELNRLASQVSYQELRRLKQSSAEMAG